MKLCKTIILQKMETENVSTTNTKSQKNKTKIDNL